MSVNDLLSALSAAQKEREGCIEELRKEAESQRRRAETAEDKVMRIQDEVRQIKDRGDALNQKNALLEERLETERESHERELKQKGDEYKSGINDLKEEIESLGQKLKLAERENIEVNEELTLVKTRLKKVINEEENLIRECKKLRTGIHSLQEEWEKAKKAQEMSESELHLVKMQLLKENNINDRLLEELKRSRKDIEGYRLEIGELKRRRDGGKSLIGKQMKELTMAVYETNKDSVYDDLREIRNNLSSILKENFVINSKMNEMYKFLVQGGTEKVESGTQTTIGAAEMFSYDNLDREATTIVMKLREELVMNKNDLVDMKRQNDILRNVIREMKREKERQQKEEEDEGKVDELEEAVRMLKRHMKEDERNRKGRGRGDFKETLEMVKQDVEQLKSRLNQQNGDPERDSDLGSILPIRTRPLVKRNARY